MTKKYTLDDIRGMKYSTDEIKAMLENLKITDVPLFARMDSDTGDLESWTVVQQHEDGNGYLQFCSLIDAHDGGRAKFIARSPSIIRGLLSRVESARKALINAREWETPVGLAGSIFLECQNKNRRQCNEVLKILNEE